MHAVNKLVAVSVLALAQRGCALLTVEEDVVNIPVVARVRHEDQCCFVLPMVEVFDVRFQVVTKALFGSPNYVLLMEEDRDVCIAAVTKGPVMTASFVLLMAEESAVRFPAVALVLQVQLCVASSTAVESAVSV
jgi:hypothetical protein